MDGDGSDKYRECVRALSISNLNARKAALAKRFDETKDMKLLREISELDKKLKTIRQSDDA